jgi:hypothetical protein
MYVEHFEVSTILEDEILSDLGLGHGNCLGAKDTDSSAQFEDR